MDQDNSKGLPRQYAFTGQISRLRLSFILNLHENCHCYCNHVEANKCSHVGGRAFVKWATETLRESRNFFCSVTCASRSTFVSCLLTELTDFWQCIAVVAKLRNSLQVSSHLVFKQFLPRMLNRMSLTSLKRKKMKLLAFGCNDDDFGDRQPSNTGLYRARKARNKKKKARSIPAMVRTATSQLWC